MNLKKKNCEPLHFPIISGTTKAKGGGGQLYPDINEKILHTLQTPMYR